MDHTMKVSVRDSLGLAALACALQNAAASPPNTEFKPAPRLIREYFLAVKDAALGREHSVLLLENGSLRCTGWNGVSVYVDGSVVDWVNWTQSNSPFFFRRPNLPVNIKAVAAGWNHVLALSADGKVFAWGYNNKGQCNVPADVTSAVAVAGAFEHSAAFLGDGKLRIWGEQVPPVSELPEFTSIDAWNDVTAGITKDGGVIVIDRKTGTAKKIPLFGVFDRP